VDLLTLKDLGWLEDAGNGDPLRPVGSEREWSDSCHLADAGRNRRSNWHRY